MNWTQVGKVKDAHNLKGEVYLLVFSGDISWAQELKQAQLGAETFDVEKIRPHKEGLIVKFKRVENRNQAEALKGRMFSISDELLISGDGETIFLAEIKNFEFYDKNLGLIGIITDFSDNRAQDLLIVEGAKGRFEIPFVEAFILDIDYKLRRVNSLLPEGLLSINQQDPI